MKALISMKPASLLILLCATGLSYAGVIEDVSQLQSRWADVNYTLEGDAQKDAFAILVEEADKVTSAYPDAAEAWIWNGIIKSSYAGAKGGLGALGLVKDSRKSLEKALSIDPDAMQGSAYTSLGTLYFKVPGWPIAFGDDGKAEELLKQALKINPDGIDSNYFYGEFLMEDGKYEEASDYLLKARQAPPRPNRPLADKGRQQEINDLLATIEERSVAAKESDRER
ncbi:MAG: tetratricopeptide repeat protein [Gammaproteobacteria bacterium]